MLWVKTVFPQQHDACLYLPLPPKPTILFFGSATKTLGCKRWGSLWLMVVVRNLLVRMHIKLDPLKAEQMFGEHFKEKGNKISISPGLPMVEGDIKRGCTPFWGGEVAPLTWEVVGKLEGKAVLGAGLSQGEFEMTAEFSITWKGQPNNQKEQRKKRKNYWACIVRIWGEMAKLHTQGRDPFCPWKFSKPLLNSITGLSKLLRKSCFSPFFLLPYVMCPNCILL